MQAVDHLRPIERRVLAMRAGGVPVPEIAKRIRKSPEHVERILAWSELPRQRPPEQSAASAVQRRVLAMRAEGQSHEEIGERFRRSPRHIRQVEGMAHYRKGLELLS